MVDHSNWLRYNRRWRERSITSGIVPSPSLERLKSLAEAFWTWLLSLVFMIGLPSLPLGIEAAQNMGHVEPYSYYLTAAVLAASYGISSDHNSFRCGYVSVFLGTLVLLFQPKAGPTWFAPGWASNFMIVTATIHASERFKWHVVLNRRFPDWLEG
jgi:hypothetical protein